MTSTLFLILSLSLSTAFHTPFAAFRSTAIRLRAEPTSGQETRVVDSDTEESQLQKREAYFCNDEGCWVGEVYYCDDEKCWVEAAPPIELPDGRVFGLNGKLSEDSLVESYNSFDACLRRKKAIQGIFAPLVKGAKTIAGEKEINKLRGKVIAEHTKVISAFVDTSESPFGQIVLKRMFEAADADGNGTLDKEEVRAALHALGFTFVEDKQLNQIFNRADSDGDEVIDFEEFVKETPKTLRSSLVKMAKNNGHDLGFLA
uniref:EF-hand domain-containing protein n=1 Tax=Octactis speculum TaxID=3111310 RepID=A0A7S2GLW8_9STRA|mmetsp:Transcript_50678/g.68964  ORF Transcript_50678/g.68964 Transcript_50678/m.68964 type:complete len:259 (+) Transcript_50678:84-860(+)